LPFCCITDAGDLLELHGDATADPKRDRGLLIGSKSADIRSCDLLKED
jgi:hypothetical protein